MPRLHDSVITALANDATAIEALLALLPASKRNCRALPLPPPANASGLLVGRLLPLSDGTLVISAGRASHCPAVLAPAPPPRLRAALVYCPDFRAVRARTGRVVLELLAERVRPLRPCAHYAPPADAPAETLAAAGALVRRGGRRRNVRARVLAKSPVMGAGRSRRFFLEIGSLADAPAAANGVAVFVVFVGPEALKWWPFLRCEKAYTFVGMKHAKLPRYGNRNVFKVSDELANVYEFAGSPPSPASQVAPGVSPSSSPPRKRLRSGDVASMSEETGAVEAPTGNAPFRWSDGTVTYQGVITDVLPDGRIQLDRRVYLHLGGEAAWCGGNSKTFVCFRAGTRIEALNVLIAFQRGVPTTIFPTARTVVNVVYFGPVPSCGVVEVQEWRNSPWFRYWSHLSPPYILWAQELFDTLPNKFRLWLASSQPEDDASAPQSSSSMAHHMLGTNNEAGLIEYVMELVTGSKRLFQRNQPPTFFYSDFLDGNQAVPLRCEDASHNFPYAASLAEISGAVDVKWLASNKAGDGSANARTIVEVFSNKDLSHVLCNTSGRIRNHCGTNIVLIGMLEGCTDSSSTAQIADATGSMHVEFSGDLDPSLLGAIVVMHIFIVVVELFPGSAKRKATLLLHPSNMQVLIDGPYVDLASIEQDEDLAMTGRASQGFRRGDSSVRLSLSQSNAEDDLAAEEDIDDFPLAAVCIDSVSAIVEHSDGQPRFRIKGFLVAFCSNRRKQNWSLLSLDGQFSRCCLVIHGTSATKIRAALTEGRCYGIGCSDFANCDDIAKLCKQRAEYGAKMGRPLLLFSASSDNGIWVQRVGGTIEVRAEIDENEAGEVTEREMAVEKAVDSFLKEYKRQTDTSLMKMLSPSWKPTSLGSDRPFFRIPMNDLVSFFGVFLCFEMCPSPNSMQAAGRAPSFRLAIREMESSFITAHVLFSGSVIKPRGLAPGTAVRLLNVRRVGMGDGRVLFSAGAFTRVVPITSELGANEAPSLCCNRPLQGNDVLLPLFPQCFLSTFSFGAAMERKDSTPLMYGLVRVNVLDIKTLRFHVNSGCKGCANCRCLNGSEGCVGGHATAAIEDGTTYGELLCQTFQTVMELLGATEEDSLTFRQALPEWQPTREALSGWKDSRYAVSAVKSEADIVLERLLVSCRRSLHTICKNMCNGAGSVPSSESPMIDEAEVRGHNLGFGKKLWTAESSKMHQVQLQALAIFEEDGLLADEQVPFSSVISVQERYLSQFS